MMISRGSLVALLTLAACLPCAAKTDPNYRDEVRSDLRKNLSPQMWGEFKDMLDRSPAQATRLTPEEAKQWRALLQLQGNQEPAWLHNLRTANPTLPNIEDTRP